MKFLALETVVPGVPVASFTEGILREEAAQAWRLHKSGVIRELYFQVDQDRAVLVLECADKEEARLHLASLPLVEKGLIAFEIIPLKTFPGFERLFG